MSGIGILFILEDGAADGVDDGRCVTAMLAQFVAALLLFFRLEGAKEVLIGFEEYGLRVGGCSRERSWLRLLDGACSNPPFGGVWDKYYY